MQLKQNAKYAIVAPTSMGVRITPKDRQPVQISHDYVMYATSAESNVLNVAASVGMNTKVLTSFVSGSPIAAFIKAELRARNIEFEGAEVPQGGPWGYRFHCLYGLKNGLLLFLIRGKEVSRKIGGLAKKGLTTMFCR